MKYVLLIIVMFCSWLTFGQKIRFTDTTNQWTIVDGRNSPSGIQWGMPRQVRLGEDTVINGKHYRLFDDVFVREDTNQQKVYAKVFGHMHIDTAERILYDYNLRMGDTLRQTYGDTMFATHIVVDLDSVLINNIYHRTYKFEYLHGYVPFFMTTPGYDVVEGIGCAYFNPLFPIEAWYFEGGSLLSCFQNQYGRPDIGKSIVRFDNKCTLSALQMENNELRVDISPNPVNERSIIKLPYTLKAGSLIISNAFGQVILKKQLIYTDELEIDKQYNPGVYYYQIINNEGERYFGKFISL
jgi:hypothetical protein